MIQNTPKKKKKFQCAPLLINWVVNQPLFKQNISKFFSFCQLVNSSYLIVGSLSPNPWRLCRGGFTFGGSNFSAPQSMQ
jgi:hypothetical protein